MSRRRRFAAASLALAALAWIGWRAVRLGAGSPARELEASTWTESTRVLARDGRLLGERRSASGLLGRHTPLALVSPRLVDATLVSEDRHFHAHDGIDRAALVRALVQNVTRRHVVQGGSTLTSQLVKRLDHRGIAHRRTLPVKLLEMARAQNLEAELDKPRILEAYLDHLDYGHGLAGPEAAAQGYFGSSAADLSLAQAALLAVLPRAPSALDPYRHLDRAVRRQRALLQRMRAVGVIDDDSLARALAEPLRVKPRSEPSLVAPHVVLSAARAREREVTTTLDFDLQRDVEGIVRGHAGGLRARGAGSVAALVVDNATGEVLAEVGSADYFDVARAGAVDLVRVRRQAGSTLKPVLYAHAFERGLSPTAALPDVPTELGATGAVYAPDNFDGHFVGPVSAREALGGSLNVPAVRLTTEMGAKEAVDVLRRSGLELAGGAERYGVSIALGSAEVSPWELAGVYATLARGGTRVALTDRRDPSKDPSPGGPAGGPAGEGGVALEGERVLREAEVALVTDALADSLARVRGLHARGPFELPFPTALKTGTSTGYRDAWTAGYTRERTVVVWVGNASGASTDRLTGASGAGPVFFDVMKRAMRDVGTRKALVARDLLEEAEVCPLSGEAPGEACPDRVTRRFARGRSPTHACSMHRHAGPRARTRDFTGRSEDRKDLRDAAATGTGDPQIACVSRQSPLRDRTIVVLPDVYARFLGERAPGAPGLDAHGMGWFLASRTPGCSEGVDLAADAREARDARVVLVKPRPGAVLHVDAVPSSADAFEVVASTEGLPADIRLDVLVDGELRTSLTPPYRAMVPVAIGEHAVEVRPSDPRVRGRLARAGILVR